MHIVLSALQALTMALLGHGWLFSSLAQSGPVGNRVKVNGIQMYYEVSGKAIR